MFYKNAFFYFGGYDVANANVFSNVLRLDSKTFKWSLLGQRTGQRAGGSVIVIQNQFLIMGGRSYGYLETEKCIIENDQISCVFQEPRLKDHFVPVLMHVQDDYCKP